MNFIADHTMPAPSVEEIRTLGNLVDVIEAPTDDERRELLRRATDEERVVLSFDYDYHDLVFGGGDAVPPGVVCFRVDWDTPRDPANLLVALLTDEDLSIEGQFTLLEGARMRQKALPR